MHLGVVTVVALREGQREREKHEDARRCSYPRSSCPTEREVSDGDDWRPRTLPWLPLLVDLLEEEVVFFFEPEQSQF